jgi:acyl carrier protein
MADPLVELFATILGIDAAELSETTAPANTAEWDSISNISLVTEIEAIFDVVLTTSDIESMGSIGKTRSVLKRHGVAGI